MLKIRVFCFGSSLDLCRILDIDVKGTLCLRISFARFGGYESEVCKEVWAGLVDSIYDWVAMVICKKRFEKGFIKCRRNPVVFMILIMEIRHILLCWIVPREYNALPSTCVDVFYVNFRERQRMLNWKEAKGCVILVIHILERFDILVGSYSGFTHCFKSNYVDCLAAVEIISSGYVQFFWLILIWFKQTLHVHAQKYERLKIMKPSILKCTNNVALCTTCYVLQAVSRLRFILHYQKIKMVWNQTPLFVQFPIRLVVLVNQM